MNDVNRENVINNIVAKMHLDDEMSKKLKYTLYMELHRYSLVEVANTDLAVWNETKSEEAYRMFFVSKKIQGCTKRTLKYYRDIVDAFADFIRKPLLEVETNDIRYYLAVKKERDGNSDVTMNNIRRGLNSFYNWCVEEDYIHRSPCVKIKKIKEEKKVKEPLSEIEIEALRNGAKEDQRLMAIIETLLSTGCRVAELANMDRKDIKGDELVVYGKGRKERVVYLNARAQFALQEYLKTRQDENPALFVTLDAPHDRLKIAGIEICVRKLGKKTGVKNVHPHRFRRTAATMALNRGMPLDQVSQMLGHSNLDTTSIYAITSQEQVKANHKKYLS